jgi:transposase
VELFEQIRRDKDREGLSERALAKRYRVGRGTVRQALESAAPPPRKRPEGRLISTYEHLIDEYADETRVDAEAEIAKARRSGLPCDCPGALQRATP